VFRIPNSALQLVAAMGLVRSEPGVSIVCWEGSGVSEGGSGRSLLPDGVSCTSGKGLIFISHFSLLSEFSAGFLRGFLDRVCLFLGLHFVGSCAVFSLLM
jgi:hypothetical protein